MKSHYLRLIVIACCFVVAVVALVVTMALKVADSSVTAALVTAIGLLGAALTDAGVVEKRRRDPTQKAVGDDIESVPPPA